MRLRADFLAPILLVLVLTLSAVVPPAARAAIRGSFLVGGTTSWFGGDAHDIAADPYRAFSGGFGPRFTIGGSWSIEPQLWWMSKGGEGSFEFSSTGSGFNETTRFDFTWHSNYIELPVLVRFDLGNGSVRTHLGAGGTVAYRISSGSDVAIQQVTVENPPIGLPQRLLQGANIFEGIGTLGGPQFNDWDAGLAMSAGVTFGGPGPRVALDVRYLHGLVDILPTGLEGQNHTLLAAIGVEW